jgi:hypothetical protein
VVLICAQERGYASDPTHIRFVDDADLKATAQTWGASMESSYSFPFPDAPGGTSHTTSSCALHASSATVIAGCPTEPCSG